MFYFSISLVNCQKADRWLLEPKVSVPLKINFQNSLQVSCQSLFWISLFVLLFDRSFHLCPGYFIISLNIFHRVLWVIFRKPEQHFLGPEFRKWLYRLGLTPYHPNPQTALHSKAELFKYSVSLLTIPWTKKKNELILMICKFAVKLQDISSFWGNTSDISFQLLFLHINSWS